MQTLQSDFYCRMEYKNQYKEGITLEVLKVQLHSKKKTLGHLLYPISWLKMLGHFVGLFLCLLGYFKKQRNQLG